MGTSVNQKSPATANWTIAQQAYRDASISDQRALQEIWRAALNQPEGDLGAQLQNPAFARLAALVPRWESAADAAREAARFVREEKVSSLAGDLARRAAIQSAGDPKGSAQFVHRLFAEATNYLVSRDLPGFITRGERLQSIGEARALKLTLVDLTTRVAAASQPSTLTARTWARGVGSVLDALRKQRHQA